MSVTLFRNFALLVSALLTVVFVASGNAQPNSAPEVDQLENQLKALYEDGKYAEAVPLAEKAVEILRTRVGEQHPDYADSLQFLGRIYRAQARYADAEQAYKRALAVDEKALGQEHISVASVLGDLGNLYKDQNRYAEAEPLFRRGLAIFEKALGPDDLNVSTLLNNLAALSDDQGKYSAAEPLYKRSLSIREKALGPDDPRVAISLSNLASLYANEGRYAEAEPLYQRSLAIEEKARGPEHLAVALMLNNLGSLYRSAGKLDAAEPLMERSLAIREKVLGPDHLEVAVSLNNLAELKEEQSKYVDAESLLKRSLAIKEKVFGADNTEVATAQNNLAALYKRLGRYSEAGPLYQRSLAIREKVLGLESLDVAVSLNNIADFYVSEARYTEAEPLYQRSLTIKEKVLGPDHLELALTLNNLAAALDDQSKYAEAEPLYMRSLTIMQKVLGPDHPDVATTLGNLAELYANQGRYAEAEPLFARSVTILKKALGPDHPDVAQAMNNLGNIYGKQGRLADAEPLLARSLAIREEKLGADHPDVANSLNSLGELYKADGRYSNAEPLLKRSLSIREKALGPDHPDVASALSNLAELYETEGRLADAEPLYQRSLAIREKTLGPDHPDTSISLNNLGELDYDQGKYAEAEPLLKRSLAVSEKAAGKDHLLAVTGEENLAVLYAAQGRYEEAEPFFQRSLQSLSRQFDTSFSFMSEKDRLAFLTTVSSAFPMYVSFAATYRLQQPQIAGEVYDMLLWERGMIASSMAAQRRRIAASGDAEALKLLDQLAAKRNQYAGLAGSHPANYEQWRGELQQVGAEANALEQQLARRSTVFADQKELSRISWRDVQKKLQANDAAVEFVRFRFHDGKHWTEKTYYIALVLRRDSEQPKWVMLGEAKDLEGALLAQYRHGVALSRALIPEQVPNGAGGDVAGKTFYQAFWKPLEAFLAGAHRIYIAPDGVLNQVSLGVVPDDQGKLLIERYDLRIVNSTKDLLREHDGTRNKDAVLVGNPKFLLSEDEQRATLRQLQQESVLAPVLRASDSMIPNPAGAQSRELRPERGACATPPPHGGTICPLPATAVEIASISKLLKKGGWQVGTYHDETALEDVVKAVHHPRVLHMATHGFFFADQKTVLRNRTMSDEVGVTQTMGMEDPMLRSGLLFAGADRAFGEQPVVAGLDDGVLTAFEASTLDLLGTELVVLSACETGLGEQQNGEGVFGLRRALQEAGADAVLMSMWSVPDLETQELMTRFYEKWLGGLDKHEALRRAQLEEREVVRRRYHKDLPYYWGAFMLVGR